MANGKVCGLRQGHRCVGDLCGRRAEPYPLSTLPGKASIRWGRSNCRAAVRHRCRGGDHGHEAAVDLGMVRPGLLIAFLALITWVPIELLLAIYLRDHRTCDLSSRDRRRRA